jgi:hypothetical protein
MQEASCGGLPVNMTIRVEGERILITCANSAPDIPDMELSVKIKSWVLGSNRESASSALRAVSTTYPTLSKNHLVKTRMSSLSSTSSIVLIRGVADFSTNKFFSDVVTAKPSTQIQSRNIWLQLNAIMCLLRGIFFVLVSCLSIATYGISKLCYVKILRDIIYIVYA